MTFGRWCQIARAGTEKSRNPIAAISAHLSKLPEMPQNLASPPLAVKPESAMPPKKKAARFGGLLFEIMQPI